VGHDDAIEGHAARRGLGFFVVRVLLLVQAMTFRILLLSLTALGAAACGASVETPMAPPTTATTSTATASSTATTAAPEAKKEPVDECDHGTLPECGESCRLGIGDACKEFGKRSCTEGSVVECGKACDGGNDTACDALSEMYEYGTRVDQDRDKALAIDDRGCTKGRRESCQLAGRVTGKERDEADRDSDRYTELAAKAVRYYDAACDGQVIDKGDDWSGSACSELMTLEPARVLPKLESACGRGVLTGCAVLLEDKAADKTTKVDALRALCANDLRSDYCGRLKDMGASLVSSAGPTVNAKRGH
jgi:hypothetical protein